MYRSICIPVLCLLLALTAGCSSPQRRAVSTPARSSGPLPISASALKAEKQLGIPVYPGAVPDQSAGGISQAGQGMVTAVLKTSDSPGMVVQYYQQALTLHTAAGSKIQPAVTHGSMAGEATTILNQKEKGSIFNVEIRPNSQGATIQLMRLPGSGMPASIAGHNLSPASPAFRPGQELP